MEQGTAHSVRIQELAEVHYDGLWQFCYRRVGRDMADDAVQETFEIAWKQANRYRGESDPKTWLFGIGLNVCRNHLRKRKKNVSLDWIDWLANESHETQSLAKLTLLRALSTLSEEHREVIVLSEIEGFSYPEISVLIGVPVGTVKSRMHHAFSNLRSQIQQGETQ